MVWQSSEVCLSGQYLRILLDQSRKYIGKSISISLLGSYQSALLTARFIALGYKMKKETCCGLGFQLQNKEKVPCLGRKGGFIYEW